MQWEIRRYGVVGSTNDELKLLAEGGAVEGTVVVAEGQSAGRGRAGHKWFSPEGRGLYFSCLLRPAVQPEQLPTLTLMAGIATCDAIDSHMQVCGNLPSEHSEREGGPRSALPNGGATRAPAIDTFMTLPAQIKWPNDIWLARRKVGGILCECVKTFPSPCPLPIGERGNIIIGIGINVNLRQDEFPRELQETATSLAALRGQPMDKELVMQAILVALAAHYRQWKTYGWSGLKQSYLARSATEGKRVRVKFGDHVQEGLVQGVDESGGLVLIKPDGRKETVVAGEVEICF